MRTAALLRPLHGLVYARRIRELVRLIAPHLHPGETVLDVGCGSGALGHALLDSPLVPPDVRVTGLERRARPDAMIPVEIYGGGRIPRAAGSCDVVILADVLHHERDPHALLAECVRVARRILARAPRPRADRGAPRAPNLPSGFPAPLRRSLPPARAGAHPRNPPPAGEA